jgi:hypothetical protein
MCGNWNKEICGITNGKAKCPAWGFACGKFKDRVK